jgi:hypothetical protein
MNDDDLITLVRESFTDLHATTPVERIVRRGHAVRARRRIPVLAGALAVVAAAALAVTTLLPGAHRPAPQPGTPPAQLAAWTVTRQADGIIRVTIRQLRNPAELQRQLRADGVPASVTLTGRENPACRPYPASPTLRKAVLSITFDVIPLPHQGPPPSNSPPQPNLVLVFHINPRALPAGTGVQIATSYAPVRPGLAQASLGSGLVYASAQCTGS